MMEPIFRRAAELLAANRRFALLHLVRVRGSSPGKAGFKLLVTDRGERLGTIGGGDSERKMIEQAQAAMAEGKSRVLEYELTIRPGNLVRSNCGGTNEVFIEVFMPKPCLLILGAGHTARALAAQCRALDYPYVILDDRPEYARREDFPGALDVVQARGTEYLARPELPEFSHVVGLGYDSQFDLDAMVPAIKRFGAKVRYGFIGSRPKAARMADNAAARGLTPEEWALVKCPVGLNIGAQTPAEIAVSIIAEVVAGIPGRESASWKHLDKDQPQ